MKRPSQADREKLDRAIESLARLGDPLTIDDFRTHTLQVAKATAFRIRAYVILFSAVFLSLTVWVLLVRVARDSSPRIMETVTFWSFALGGLGAVANIFLHLLKLTPKQSINTSDEFEVFARILLGCLFATILSVTLFHEQIVQFFESFQPPRGSQGMRPDSRSGALALAPFLFGYSIPLVLTILEKIVLAIELTIGADVARSRVPKARGARRAP